MSNIEDDLEEVKTFAEYSQEILNDTEYERPVDVTITQKEVSAIKNILQEREQDKARIKELEEERQLVGMPVRNKRSGKIGIVLHQWESRSIAVLENISPRVINTHDSWDTLEIITDEIKQTKTESDSIPKQKVKDIAKQIQEEYDKVQEQFDCIWNKKSKDNYDRYKLQELSAMQQELGFILGKFEKLLEEGK